MEPAGVLPPLGLAGVGLGGLPGRSSRLAGDGGITSVCGAPCPPAGAVPAAPGRPGVRASGPSPAAALPARRSRPRRLAGGGGPCCGGLGPPAALVRASGGRLACRRGVPARPGGAASPPGGRRCGVGGPGPRRPRLAGASVPGPVGRGGRSPPSRSASWRGGPSGLRPSASPCPSRPGAPQAAPYRAARLRHGRPPGLPPPGAGAAAASGRPGQSQRPGSWGLVLVLPGCCCGPGGPCGPAAWPLGDASRSEILSRVKTSGRRGTGRP